jgi:glutathione S-transferase
MSKYQLIGSECSLYSGKARAYLRYKDIPFEEVLNTPEVYETIIIPRVNDRIIPVLISPDDICVQDTTEIIDFLEERFPEISVYPETPLQRLVALLFELYGDEWLPIPAMYYRWWFKDDNYDFIVGEFGRSRMPDADPEIQRAAGEVGAGIFGGMLPLLGVTENNHMQIEEWYESFLDCLSEHLKLHPFLLGTRPSIGDFGLMGPLYAHLYRDPYPGRLMKSRAPLVANWVERMNAPEPGSGAFLPDDEVPETLHPILKMMFEEMFPPMLDTVEKLGEWLDQNPDDEIPWVLEAHEFSICGVREERWIQPYNQWMFQRPIDYYQTLSGMDRERADEFLRLLGGYEGMQVNIRRRVKRKNHKLLPDN